MVAGPDGVLAGLEVGTGDGEAVDVFSLEVAFEDARAVDEDVAAPAGVIDADLLHLDAARGRGGIQDGALFFKLVHHEIGPVEGDQADLDRDGVREERDDERQQEKGETKTGSGRGHFNACRQT